MLFEWTESKIDLYVRASKETGFHRKLAEQIIPYFDKNDEVADIGCGPGLIDFDISPHVKKINAIDIDPKIIGFLKEEVERNNIDNIAPSIGDAETIDGVPCDVVLFCYFNSIGEHMHKLIGAARRLAIIIMHGAGTAGKPSKISANVRKTNALDMEEILSSHGYSYTKKELKLDFSQPLKTTEEARKFLEMYCTEEVPEERKNKIEEGLKNLKHSNHVFYPYSITNMKDATIFIVTK